MHLDDERIQRLLANELDPRAREQVEAHARACFGCSELLANAEQDRREVNALLQLVDHPRPTIEPGEIAAVARRQRPGWGRLAAGVLVALVMAGAAYALPGSPFRRWAQAVSAWVRSEPNRQTARPAPVQAPEPAPAGVAVAPGRSLLLQFMNVEAQGQARITLTDGADVVVRAPAGAASFTSDVDRLLIDNRNTAATFEIQIPRGAARVEIRVATRQIFLKLGSRITAEGSLDPEGSYRIPLGKP
jgi:hypothetical protein